MKGIVVFFVACMLLWLFAFWSAGYAAEVPCETEEPSFGCEPYTECMPCSQFKGFEDPGVIGWCYIKPLKKVKF